jgi:hypothetical protein
MTGDLYCLRMLHNEGFPWRDSVCEGATVDCGENDECRFCNNVRRIFRKRSHKPECRERLGLEYAHQTGCKLTKITTINTPCAGICDA